MMTVFQILNCVTGVTEGFKTREAADTFIAKMDRAGFVYDWLPAPDEGFYVINQRGAVKSGAHDSRADASRFADAENMASDVNSFSVIEHRL